MRSLAQLARMADCPSTPEGEDTEGAKWLRRVEQDAEEAEEQYYDEYSNRISEDAVFEIADGLVPIYTNELWNVWVDCGGYNHDGQYRDFVSSSESGNMMNRIAQADCYEWAVNMIQEITRAR